MSKAPRAGARGGSSGAGRGGGGGARRAAPAARRGLLGVYVAGSSDDEDYVPPDIGGDSGSGTAASRSKAAKAAPRKRARATPSQPRRRSAAGGERGGGSDSGSETLAQRRQRMVAQQRVGASGGGGAAAALPAVAGNAFASAAAAAQQEEAPALPLPVLSQIFLLACARGALPTACRLARVCRAWRAAVDATPELWRVVDARGRRNKRADAWVQQQAASGRWRALRDLTVGQVSPNSGGGGGGGSDDDDDDGGGGAGGADGDGGGRRGDPGTSPEALLALAAHCPELRRLTVSGAPAIHADALRRAVLSLPALRELRLWGVRVQPLAGLEGVAAALLAAAWGGARPLEVFEARGCPLIGNKTVRFFALQGVEELSNGLGATCFCALPAPLHTSTPSATIPPPHPPCAAQAALPRAGDPACRRFKRGRRSSSASAGSRSSSSSSSSSSAACIG